MAERRWFARKGTERKQVTGTSYTADPAIEPGKPNYSELGSQKEAPIRDVVPELGTRVNSIREYRKMRRSDSSVRSSLRAGKAPILGADFFIEPYDDTPECEMHREFVDFNLFRAPNVPFVKTLSDVLTMFDYGSSTMEHTWELREWAPKLSAPGANRRNYTMLRKLALRPASTITTFNYDDNGGPESVTQQAVRKEGRTEEITIPINKLMIFTFDGEGGNLEGESILRSAHPHWFYKYNLYKIDAIQKERHGIGVPDIELLASASADDAKLAGELGRNLRTNESAYIVRPPTLKVGFAELHGNLVDVLASINHHDNMIMKNILVQFLNMGVSGEGGGRATAATALDMFIKAMSFVANYICDCYNMYLIPKMVAYNFETDKFPKMSVRNIGETKDLQMWSAAMRNLSDAGYITLDEETEQFVRRVMDMPRLRGGRKPVEPNTGNGKADVPITGRIEKMPNSGA